MKTLKELNETLDANIPRSAVKQRKGAGSMSFSYLSTDYVIDRMNRTFGNLNWATDTVENKAVFVGEVNGKHVAHYIARVKVEAQHIDENGRVVRTSHCGTGYGDGNDGFNPGKAHELAAKEAESDALKRACKNLGQSMGLALYDKDQTNVSEDLEPRLASAATSQDGHYETAEQKRTKGAAPATILPGELPRLNAALKADTATRPAFKRDEPSAAAPPREQLRKRISALSKILNAQGKATYAQQKEQLKARYNVESQDALSDAQAAELVKALDAQAAS